MKVLERAEEVKEKARKRELQKLKSDIKAADNEREELQFLYTEKEKVINSGIET